MQLHNISSLCTLACLLAVFSSVLCQSVLGSDDNEGITNIVTQDQFYQIVNNNTKDKRTNYYVVKYYTTWCSHCKKLKPVFEQLNDFFSDTSTNVHLLEVDCDIFSGNLCKGLPGYPIIKIITSHGNDDDDDDDDDNYDKTKFQVWENMQNERTIWDKLIPWHWGNNDKNPMWNINDDRIIQYQGSRDFKSIKNFILKLIEINDLNRLFSKCISNNKNKNSNDFPDDDEDTAKKFNILNEYYKTILLKKNIIQSENEFIVNETKLNKERVRLENITRNYNNNNKQEIQDDDTHHMIQRVKLQLLFLNWIEDQATTNNNYLSDEL